VHIAVIHTYTSNALTHTQCTAKLERTQGKNGARAIYEAAISANSALSVEDKLTVCMEYADYEADCGENVSKLRELEHLGRHMLKERDKKWKVGLENQFVVFVQNEDVLFVCKWMDTPIDLDFVSDRFGY
jgi:hypothetical protein